MNTAILFDTETTGIKDSVLIEAAYRPIVIKPRDLAEGEGLGVFPAGPVFEQRYNPGVKIEFGAMATHLITDEDLVDCPPSSEFALPDGVKYLIGHKVDFDWQVIGKPDIKRIDTLPLCQKLWPEMDSHKQLAILYMLDRQKAKALASGAHSAGTDIEILASVFEAIVQRLNLSSFEDLWVASEAARIPEIMPFGKHKGMDIKDVPASYKSWLLDQPDVDDYLAMALRKRPPTLDTAAASPTPSLF